MNMSSQTGDEQWSRQRRLVGLLKKLTKMELRKKIPHIFTVVLLVLTILVFRMLTGSITEKGGDYFDPFERYGKWPSIIMYIMRVLSLIPLPLSFCNFFGIVLYNTHPHTPHLKTTLLFGPSVCFRVVTRGTFPDLVKKNVHRNIQLCSDVGLNNYVFEIATDNPINITESLRVREIVIPDTYKTRNGTLFKARALQFCLEDGVSLFEGDDDWIVHLDEETLLTESSIIGIMNFINEGQHHFGQGVITYANEEVVSLIMTIGDSIRVGMDYGILRFSMKFLHKPLFSWKGSFIVANAAAERRITFDFGPDGSMAEDCFFALVAWEKGYSFNFIEGEMWEKSTFSAMDYIKQRNRWVKGILKVLLSAVVPTWKKLGISIMVLSWITMPLTVPNIILAPVFPLPMPNIINLLCSFMGGVGMFLYIFGTMKSFSLSKIGTSKYAMLCFSPIFLLPLFLFLESCAIILAIYSPSSSEFHIVSKDISDPRVTVV